MSAHRFLVKLTQAQREALRSLASVHADANEPTPDMARTLRRAVDALDDAIPALSEADYRGWIAARVGWEGENMDREDLTAEERRIDRLGQKILKLRDRP